MEVMHPITPGLAVYLVLKVAEGRNETVADITPFPSIYYKYKNST